MDDERYVDKELEEINKLTPEEIEKIRKKEKFARIFKAVAILSVMLFVAVMVTLFFTGYGQIAGILIVVFFSAAGGLSFLAAIYLVGRVFFKDAKKSKEYKDKYKSKHGKRPPVDGVKVKSVLFIIGFVGGITVGAVGLFLENLAMGIGGIAFAALTFLIGIIASRFF